MVAGFLGQGADLVDQLHPGGEVARAEDGERDRPQDAPVVDAVGVVELSGSDEFSHGCTLGGGTDSDNLASIRNREARAELLSMFRSTKPRRRLVRRRSLARRPP
jgi:hypothetical protein